jgi:hypothetical protein
VIVVLHTLTVLETHAEIALRLRVALLGCGAHFLKCFPCAAVRHFVNQIPLKLHKPEG